MPVVFLIKGCQRRKFCNRREFSVLLYEYSAGAKFHKFLYNATLFQKTENQIPKFSRHLDNLTIFPFGSKNNKIHIEDV
jgi:hypothetical protein